MFTLYSKHHPKLFLLPIEVKVRSCFIPFLIMNTFIYSLFKFTQASVTPSLDICIDPARGKEQFSCIDTITGPGQHQWVGSNILYLCLQNRVSIQVRRTTEIPPVNAPYKIILRARDVFSAEDVICIDDVQLFSFTSDYVSKKDNWWQTANNDKHFNSILHPPIVNSDVIMDNQVPLLISFPSVASPSPAFPLLNRQQLYHSPVVESPQMFVV